MRKLFNYVVLMAIAVMTSMSLVSCDGEKPEFKYDVKIAGEADGQVDITFPGGTFATDGATNLIFTYGNAAVDTAKVFTENQLCDTNDTKSLKALSSTNDWLANSFTVSTTSATGTYDVRLTGFVTEPLTGITVKIDKRFTNKPQE